MDTIKKSVVLIVFGLVMTAQADGSLVRPDGGECWRAGDVQQVTWNGNMLPGDVRLLLWNGRTSSWHRILESFPGKRGTYFWNIPREMKGDLFRIRVELASDPSIHVTSGSFFTIKEPASDPLNPANLPQPPEFIKIVPNPSDLSATISWEGAEAEHLSIIDLQGRTHHNERVAGRNNIQIPVSNLDTGMYYVQIRLSDKSTHRSKMIVRH